MFNNIKSFFVLSIFVSLIFTSNAFATVKFVHLTDPHMFESKHRHHEADNSYTYSFLGIEVVNELADQHKKMGDPIDFALFSGDFGVEKLVKEIPVDKQSNQGIIIDHEGSKRHFVIDDKKWQAGVIKLSNVIKRSKVDLWLFVPGNNDLFEEIPETVHFYEKFVKDLNTVLVAQKSAVRIVDFRQESTDRIGDNPPGVLKIEDKILLGWDNAFFKNNYSIKPFLKPDGTPKDFTEFTEYKSIKRLEQALETSDAKYAYIFLHIPEVDDPWRVQFQIDDDDNNDNTVCQALREAERLSPKLAKGLYPYSAWMVPYNVRVMWEDFVLNNKDSRPTIKGLFAGHFHDHNKSTFYSFDWMKTVHYKKKILDMYHIAPSISLKNQAEFPIKDRARGLQFVEIKENGNVSAKIHWLGG